MTTNNPTLGGGAAHSGTAASGSVSSTSSLSILSEKLLVLEDIVRHCAIPTGSPIQDLINQTMLSVLSSPNGSDVQERLISEACGGAHKGEVKLGADAVLGDGADLEVKPSKSAKTTSSVNITDDTPSRLLKDLNAPTKKVAIGRCPGGKKFRWVVVCPMTDFAESRYRAMCKHWGQPEALWPSTIEEQIPLVEALVSVQGTNKYLRSSQLKFDNVKTIVGGWVHPEATMEKAKSAEDRLMQRLAGK
jgi:hypothetical protein